jgi:glycosyltransferase involved in cell wall biosynthesis
MKKIFSKILNRFPFIRKIIICFFSICLLRKSKNSKKFYKRKEFNKSKNILPDVTIIIKTFERPRALDSLIKSIYKFYSNINILVADDSRNPVIREDVDYYTMPFNSGLSAGRNLLLDQINTPYFLLLDDDFIFNNETKIEELKKVLQKGFDIVGGNIIGCSYSGIFNIKKNILFYNNKYSGYFNGYPLYDFIPNFFWQRQNLLGILGGTIN